MTEKGRKARRKREKEGQRKPNPISLLTSLFLLSPPQHRLIKFRSSRYIQHTRHLDMGNGYTVHCYTYRNPFLTYTAKAEVDTRILKKKSRPQVMRFLPFFFCPFCIFLDKELNAPIFTNSSHEFNRFWHAI